MEGQDIGFSPVDAAVVVVVVVYFYSFELPTPSYFYCFIYGVLLLFFKWELVSHLGSMLW